jgi:hypothetical protein
VRRFPLRTLLLMVVALLAFIRFWLVTHRQEEPPTPSAPASPRRGFLIEVPPEPADGGHAPPP